MKLQEVSVPLCTVGKEKLAGEPVGMKGWSRRLAERAAEMSPALYTTRKEEEIKRQSAETKVQAREKVSVKSKWIRMY